MWVEINDMIRLESDGIDSVVQTDADTVLVGYINGTHRFLKGVTATKVINRITEAKRQSRPDSP